MTETKHRAKHSIHKGKHYPRPEKMLPRMVNYLGGIAFAASEIDDEMLKSLDTKSRLAWAEELLKQLNELSRFVTRLKNGCEPSEDETTVPAKSKESQSWSDIANRFEALEKHPRFFMAHRTSEGWSLCGSTGKNAEFVALARLCLTRLGKTITSDEEALGAWMERMCIELEGPRNRIPGPNKKFVYTGINHFAAQLCRIYDIKSETQRTFRRKDKETTYPKPKRAAWLEDMLAKKRYTAHELAERCGSDHRTIKRILDGQPVQQRVLDRIADELDCQVRDIPDA